MLVDVGAGQAVGAPIVVPEKVIGSDIISEEVFTHTLPASCIARNIECLRAENGISPRTYPGYA